MQLAGLQVYSHYDQSRLGKPKAAVVLLHGFGAPGTDLVSLASNISVPQGTAFYFPEGPLDVSDAVGAPAGTSRAWWPIDMQALQIAMMRGKFEQAAATLSTGLEGARSAVVRLLDELQASLGIGSERIILGGFSQGAIASLEVALFDSRPLAGLLLMSPTLLSPARLPDAAVPRAGFPVIVSHGRADPVLPYPISELLVQKLGEAKWDVTWVPFFGGHGVPPQVLDVASQHFDRWLI